MSKERLEEIKHNWYGTTWGIDKNDIQWLIEQAERAEQNKNDWLNTMKRLENYKKVASLIHEEIQRLRDQNKRYRATINAMGQILKDAIHALDVGEKVQGLEYGVKIANDSLEVNHMSNYCTCHIDKDSCFWCDYQVVKRSLETCRKANKRYRKALENIRTVKYDDEFNPYAYMMLEIIEWAEEALEGEE